MTLIAGVVLAATVALVLYAYVGYPILLWLIGRVRRPRPRPVPPTEWPLVSVTVPVHNEEAQIRCKLERALQYDYPRHRLQILVVSDASTDRTDDIVREFAPQGVELVQLPKRGGKTAAENAALPHLRGEIIVNSDASIRVPPRALKSLIVRFSDPTVGVVSGRDVSTRNVEDQANTGESGYVGYEMWVRRLETRVAGIIGASGCFYAIRRHLHQYLVPEALSRDFAAPLIAREHGYRAVSADDAVCFVPRTASLRHEYRRKVRTMTRGLETLFYKRQLLNPFRYGWFAWMLFSHKLIRWMVPWAAVVGGAGLVWIARTEPWAAWMLGVAGGIGLLGIVGWSLPRVGGASPVFGIPTYVIAGLVAGLHAWANALRGELNPIWEPTRRTALSSD